ncbi:hypothetical protein [Blastopirellula retiformator]|uniref:DUF4919 domain-containing protein n=1 Tax=Blastopirellula retiformator TaxID=2527970 RepID=A0A5C5VIZ2_9BACT|nr:hypothetical protein [Blastopirellula retiformator]TWT38614.1 hypothetical protein Enr8_03070 [Blastopirellula retiformator]
MQELFLSLLKEPSRERYLELRKEIMQRENFAPYSDDLRRAEELLGEEKFDEAAEVIFHSMPNLLLSPSAHMLVGFVFEQQGRAEDAELERNIALLCCEAITLTGAGTEAEPYQVMRTSDEYDVLRFLGKEFTGQGLVEKNGRHYDALKCEDGEELWFEITDMYAMLSQKLRGDDL